MFGNLFVPILCGEVSSKLLICNTLFVGELLPLREGKSVDRNDS